MSIELLFQCALIKMSPWGEAAIEKDWTSTNTTTLKQEAKSRSLRRTDQHLPGLAPSNSPFVPLRLHIDFGSSSATTQSATSWINMKSTLGKSLLGEDVYKTTFTHWKRVGSLVLER